MKECFVIVTYCDTKEKVEILNNTINNLKRYNIDIMIHAHYPLDVQIQEKVNYYYYSSENPILYDRYNVFWKSVNDYKLEIKVYDYYYTVLRSWSNSINIMKDYDKLHIINYDSNVYDELFDLSKKHDNSLILLQEEDIYFATLYFCLKKQDYDFFLENIQKDKYLSFTTKTNSTFLPLVEEFIPSFAKNNSNFYCVPFKDYDMKKLVEFDVCADTRFNWYDRLSTKYCSIFLGLLNDYYHILFFNVNNLIRVKIIINDIDIQYFDSFRDGIINLSKRINEIKKIELFINDEFVSQKKLNDFFKLDSKIYKDSNIFQYDYKKDENKLYISYDGNMNSEVSIFDDNNNDNLYTTKINFEYSTIWFLTTQNLYDINNVRIEIKNLSDGSVQIKKLNIKNMI